MAAAVLPDVATLVTLASQSDGTEAVATLAPKALLLIHGMADQVLPPACAIQTYRLAKEPKVLYLLEGAGHGLDEEASMVYRLVLDWLNRYLGYPVARLG